MISNIILIIISVISIIIIYKLYIIVFGPYLTLYQYKKRYPKSIIFKYFPVLGFWADGIEGINNDKDLANKLFELENFTKDTDHKVKMIVSNHSVPGKLMFFLCDKDLVKEFIVTKNHLFVKTAKEYFLFGEFLQEGILLANGKKWKDQRSAISSLFHFQKVKDRVPIMTECANSLVENINSYNLQYKSSQIDHDLKIPTLMSTIQEITSKIVIQSFFGSKNNFENKKINGQSLGLEIQTLLEQSAGYGKKNPFSILRLFMLGSHHRKEVPQIFFDKNEKNFFERADNLKEFIIEEIRTRRRQKQDGINNNNQKESDFLDVTLESNIGDNDEIICSLFLTVFFGGMDTTANLVLVSLYYLSQNLDIQTILRQEIKETFKKEEDYLNMDNYNSQKNLHKFIIEALRIKTPAPFFISRTNTQDLYLGNYFIPQGSLINISFMSMNYNAKYNTDPYKFDINRPENQENLNNFNFLPFGGGQRNCIGQHMGLCETKIIISKILSNYKVLPNNIGELEMENLFLYTPKNKNLVKLEKL